MYMPLITAIINPLFVLKVLTTFFLMILIPVYWRAYGPQNFLWLSDVGLFLSIIALWFESALLISIAMVAIFPLEIVWNIDFFFELFMGRTLIGLAHYMFEPVYSTFLKSLSLFHIFMPLLWVWCLSKWGYQTLALGYATFMLWIVLILSYVLTNPKENINWVFAPRVQGWKRLSESVWLLFLMAAFPLLLYLPTHILLKNIFISNQ